MVSAPSSTSSLSSATPSFYNIPHGSYFMSPDPLPSYNQSPPYRAWPPAPSNIPLSNYSSLNGATSDSPSAQPHQSMSPSQMMIECVRHLVSRRVCSDSYASQPLTHGQLTNWQPVPLLASVPCISNTTTPPIPLSASITYSGNTYRPFIRAYHSSSLSAASIPATALSTVLAAVQRAVLTLFAVTASRYIGALCPAIPILVCASVDGSNTLSHTHARRLYSASTNTCTFRSHAGTVERRVSGHDPAPTATKFFLRCRRREVVVAHDQGLRGIESRPVHEIRHPHQDTR